MEERVAVCIDVAVRPGRETGRLVCAMTTKPCPPSLEGRRWCRGRRGGASGEVLVQMWRWLVLDRVPPLFSGAWSPAARSDVVNAVRRSEISGQGSSARAGAATAHAGVAPGVAADSHRCSPIAHILP